MTIGRHHKQLAGEGFSAAGYGVRPQGCSVLSFMATAIHRLKIEPSVLLGHYRLEVGWHLPNKGQGLVQEGRGQRAPELIRGGRRHKGL